MDIKLECVEHKLNINKIIINSVLVLLFLALLICTPQFIKDSGSAGYMGLMCINIAGITVFALNIMFRNKKKIYNVTGSPIQCRSINCTVENNNIDKLHNALSNGNAEEIKKLKSDTKSNTVVDMIYSKDGEFGAYQISKYVPYHFEIVKEWQVVNDDSIQKLVRSLEA